MKHSKSLICAAILAAVAVCAPMVLAKINTPHKDDDAADTTALDGREIWREEIMGWETKPVPEEPFDIALLSEGARSKLNDDMIDYLKTVSAGGDVYSVTFELVGGIDDFDEICKTMKEEAEAEYSRLSGELQIRYDEKAALIGSDDVNALAAAEVRIKAILDEMSRQREIVSNPYKVLEEQVWGPVVAEFCEKYGLETEGADGYSWMTSRNSCTLQFDWGLDAELFCRLAEDETVKSVRGMRRHSDFEVGDGFSISVEDCRR